MSVPLIGKTRYTIGVRLSDTTWQFWTGDFVLLPAPALPGVTPPMKPFPCWTMFPGRAIFFQSQRAAAESAEQHDVGFGWANSISIVPMQPRTKQ